MLRRFLPEGALAPHGTGLGRFHVLVTAMGAAPSTGVNPALSWFPAPFWTVCTLAYVIVAFWLIVRTGRDLIAARRFARAVSPVEGERHERLASAIRLAGVPADRVSVSSSNMIPAVVGTLRPRIVLPLRLLDALDVDELKAVLLHEEMHRRHGDPAIALAQRLASSLLFFFPLLAPVQRRLRESAELRCDEDALGAGAQPQAYVRALARTIGLELEPSPAPAALGDGNPSLVARRLARLAEPHSRTIMTKHRAAIAVAGIILAAGVFLPVTPADILVGLDPPFAELDRLWNRDRLVSVTFDNAPAAKVLEAIAAAGSIHLSVDGAEDCCLVNVALSRVTLRDSLRAVAAQTQLRYEVTGIDSLRVTLDSPLLPTADMELPEIVTKVEPDYPKEARQAKLEGKVILQCVVREDGTVGSVQVLGLKGIPSFADAAVAAVRQWVYKPAVRNGRPVSVYYTIRVDFRLG